MKIRFIFSVPYVELRDYLGQSITNLKAVMVAAWDKLCVHTWPIAVSSSQNATKWYRLRIR